LLGAIVGRPAIVVTHKPYYDQTEKLEDMLGTFHASTRWAAGPNGFATEVLGALVLALAELVIVGPRLRARRERQRSVSGSWSGARSPVSADPAVRP
jgi:glycerol uptake facilitator protein